MELTKHPKELWILGLTELCERYAFWGVGNLLVLYLIEFYHYPNENATHIYGVFTGFAAFLPFVGGWIADHWNYQSPLFLGAVVNALGCFCLATGHHAIVSPSLILLAIGYGFFTPSIMTVLSYTYRNLPELRHAGFSIYYASINIGVFLALASLGTIAKLISWNAAFATAGFVQLMGLLPLTYYLVKHKETYQGLKKIQAKHRSRKKPLNTMEKDRLKVIGIFCLVSIFFWLTYNQAFSSMAIFVHQFMNRYIGSVLIPEGVFLSIESFFLIILAPVLATLYVKLKKKKKDLSPAGKTALSLYFMAAAFLVMMLASVIIPDKETHAHISWGYVVFAYFLIAVGEILFAPISLSVMTNLAPKHLKALSVGTWYGSLGIAYYLGGILAGLMERVGGLFNFFAIFVGIMIVPALLMTFIKNWLTKKSHSHKASD